ncbi:MAG: hypothetical protein HY763_13910 [Planctomycetes bacterium]|nr:hypothetical protein [Planctomycetota bacterium]
MRIKKAKAMLLALALGGVPLVTSGACDPRTGVFSFFRDSDNYDDGFVDVFVDDPFYYGDEVVVVDDCYYYDCY